MDLFEEYQNNNQEFDKHCVNDSEKQRRIDELDDQIWQIQQSTRSVFGFLIPFHDAMRSRFRWYYNWHLKPVSKVLNPIITIASVAAIFALTAYSLGLIGHKQVSQATTGIPKMINYQGRLTDADDILVPNGNYDFIIRIYDSESGGNCLWAWKGICGSPTAVPVSVSGGVFSVLLGDTSYQSTNALDLNFNDDSYWLQVEVEGETLIPRRRIGAVGYAYNADTVDGKHENEFALLTGRLGGQTLIGGTGVTDSLILQSTSGVGELGSDIIFRVGNNGATEAMRIAYDGKIGIGTGATVDEKLHVKDSTADSAPAIKLENDAKSWRFVIDGADNDIFKFQETSDSNANILQIASDTQVLTFSQFPITPSLAPTTDYQIANKKYVDDNSDGYWLRNSGSSYLYPKNSGDSLRVYDSTGNDYISVSHNGTDSFISFVNTGLFNIDSNSLVIDTVNDRVGIGTTSPSSALEVAGEIELANYLYFGNGTSQYLRWDSSDFILSNDLLPSADDTYSLGSDTIRWKDLYLGGESIHIGANGDQTSISYIASSDLLKFQSSANSTTAFQFTNSSGSSVFNVDTNNQRVGIGTDSPNASLEVSGDIKISDGNLFRLGSASSAPGSPSNGSMYYDSVLKQIRCYIDGSWTNCSGGGSATDEKVKISSNDTTAGYLNGKLVAGNNVTLTENNDGGDETLSIAAENSWKIISTQTITGSAVQEVNFSGFSSDDYYAFRLYFSLINGSDTETIYLMANNNTTLNQYDNQAFYMAGGTYGSARANTPQIGDIYAYGYGIVDINIFVDGAGQMVGQWVTTSTDPTSVRYRNGIVRSRSLSSAITSLKIKHQSAGGIAVGSRFVLMGIKK